MLVAVIPLLLFVAGLAGFILSARFGEATPELIDLIVGYLPVVGEDLGLIGTVRGLLEQLIQERGPFLGIGAFFLLWISTRMIGTLRTTLRYVFELEKERGIVKGKLFDLWVVSIGGFLLLLNVGLTVGIEAIQAYGLNAFGLAGALAEWIQRLTAQGIAFASAWVLFFLLYWYVPRRRSPFRSSAVGATFSAVLFELIKGAFAWYATSVADYSNAYGNLAVVAILFFWIYYSSVVFILGGQAARVHEVRRAKRMHARDHDSEGPIRGLRGAGSSLLLGLLLALPAGLAGQSIAPFGGNGNIPGFLNASEGVVLASNALERDLTLDQPLVQHDGLYVVVHIAESRVLVLDGAEVVWSARAGTGDGFQLEGQGQSWTFTTPVGMFRVLRREKDPVWIAPDWYYVENNRPIPPAADRARVPGTLGTSALFLGDGIAIHGTELPGLLLDSDPETRRVSHGCIRLTNEAARELYHLVDVGTPVLIF